MYYKSNTLSNKSKQYSHLFAKQCKSSFLQFCQKKKPTGNKTTKLPMNNFSHNSEYLLHLYCLCIRCSPVFLVLNNGCSIIILDSTTASRILILIEHFLHNIISTHISCHQVAQVHQCTSQIRIHYFWIFVIHLFSTPVSSL